MEDPNMNFQLILNIPLHIPASELILPKLFRLNVLIDIEGING